MTIKILNLYAGIGGNRKLWKGDIEVTAVENNREIAKIYKKFFPQDKVIIADAHQFLLNHFKEYDFIWSSPPCPTHSDIRRCGVQSGQYEAMYPDMQLYEEIILLQNFAPKHIKFVVENVVSYYNPLIKPYQLHRHYFWCNFVISKKKIENRIKHSNIVGSNIIHGFDISKSKIENKRKVLRNMVNPKLGLHIFEMAFEKPQQTLSDIGEKTKK